MRYRASIDPEVIAARRQSWGQTVPDFRVFDRPEDLLREPLDGVVVEGRVFENLRLARRAVESGRSVMLEKPAGEDLGEFRRAPGGVVHPAANCGYFVQLFAQKEFAQLRELSADPVSSACGRAISGRLRHARNPRPGSGTDRLTGEPPR